MHWLYENISSLLSLRTLLSQTYTHLVKDPPSMISETVLLLPPLAMSLLLYVNGDPIVQ